MQVMFDKMSEEIVFTEWDAIDHSNIGHLQNIPSGGIGKSIRNKHFKIKKQKALPLIVHEPWQNFFKAIKSSDKLCKSYYYLRTVCNHNLLDDLLGSQKTNGIDLQ